MSNASAQNVTDTLRIGTLEDPARLISPYAEFTINKDFFIEQSYGQGLYYFAENKLIPSEIESIKFDDDKLIFMLSPTSRFSVEDIIFTFEHYKEYYQKSLNPKYYFFSKISELQAINGGFSLRMLDKAVGLFNRVYLTYPILNKSDIEQANNNSKRIKSEYSTYDVNQTQSNSTVRFNSKKTAAE